MARSSLLNCGSSLSHKKITVIAPKDHLTIRNNNVQLATSARRTHLFNIDGALCKLDFCEKNFILDMDIIYLCCMQYISGYIMVMGVNITMLIRLLNFCLRISGLV